MKTRLQMILLLAVKNFATNVPAQEVSIPDPGLNSAIRETLAKPEGPLTTQDLLSLTNSSSNGYYKTRVSSLEGLGAAHHLTELNLSGNRIINLTLPAGLTNLTSLSLRENQLVSLAFPADLASLTTLDLGSNQLSNFSFLSGLTNLIHLRLDRNQLNETLMPT